MAIDIDTAQALRRPLELQQLVEAVVAAGSADEAFWLECKNNDFDLTGAAGRFKAARAILSFANRMPDAAATACEGLAYLIVGAEPGHADGTPVIDGAQIENGLIKYLGGDGPVWSPTYVKHGDKDVLVIVIEAPKWGDRMRTLRQGYNNFIEGTVFIRSGSVSRQANDDEVRLLEDRLLRGQQAPELEGLQVDFTIGPPRDEAHSSDDIAKWPQGLIALDFPREQVDEWINNRRAAIRAHHQAVIDGMEKPKSFAAALWSRPTIDDNAIETHLEECRLVLLGVCQKALINAGLSLMTMTVTNPGRRTLEHVELTITPNAPFAAFDQGVAPEKPQGLPALPPTPRPRSVVDFGTFGNLYGSRGLTEPSMLLIPRIPTSNYNPINRWLDIDDTSITLTIGQVRPEKTVLSADFHVFLTERPANDGLVVGWTLTSTSTEGVQRGTIQVPVLCPRGIIINPAEGIPEDPR